MTERFTQLEEIGRGGMGVVWKARDEETGQIVALKVLHAVYAVDPTYRKRFERELELARRIHSPNVVAVLGYGVREEAPYLIHEYVDGPSLRDRLEDHGPYTWPEARGLLIQIAQGLVDAHAAGVIHRDVKPSNILLAPDGTVKLADFGIAKALDLTRVTGTSTLLGTPAYLPPEGPRDERSDLYSLGVLAYELLTGAPPFAGDTYADVLLAHVHQTPDLAKLPPEARPIVGWLLAKDPNARPRSAAELLAALVHPGALGPVPAPPLPPMPVPLGMWYGGPRHDNRGPASLAVFGVVALAVVLVAGIGFWAVVLGTGAGATPAHEPGVSSSPIGAGTGTPRATGTAPSDWTSGPASSSSSTIVAIAAGWTDVLELRGDGTVVVAGVGPSGEANVPAGLAGVVAIAAGQNHSLALRGDGTVVAWGGNEYGQIDVPAGLTGVVKIAAGSFFSLALRNDGTVVGWGWSQDGPASGLANAVGISAGLWHSLAVKRDGTVYAWGQDTDGDTQVPLGLSGVAGVAAGFFHSLALRSDGTVVAWGATSGDHYHGQTAVPAGLTGVVAIAAGERSSLALKNDGTVVGWGSVDVPAGLSHVVAISTFWDHCVALKGDGTVVEW